MKRAGMSASTALAISGAMCSYCGEPATQIDHIDPLGAYTGMTAAEILEATDGLDLNHATNLTPACEDCNRSKGAQDLTTWLGRIVVEHFMMQGPDNPTWIRIYYAIKNRRCAPWVFDKATGMAEHLAQELTRFVEDNS